MAVSRSRTSSGESACARARRPQSALASQPYSRAQSDAAQTRCQAAAQRAPAACSAAAPRWPSPPQMSQQLASARHEACHATPNAARAPWRGAAMRARLAGGWMLLRRAGLRATEALPPRHLAVARDLGVGRDVSADGLTRLTASDGRSGRRDGCASSWIAAGVLTRLRVIRLSGPPADAWANGAVSALTQAQRSAAQARTTRMRWYPKLVLMGCGVICGARANTAAQSAQPSFGARCSCDAPCPWRA